MSLAKAPQSHDPAINAGDPTGRDIEALVREFVLSSFPLARKKHIQNADALLETGIVDSQGILELVAFIEREFRTIVDDEELIPQNFRSISRIAAFVRSKLGAPGLP